MRLGTEHLKADGTSICINDRQASYKITEYLISLGHKHIGFIKGHADYETTTHRLLGYQEALKANGLIITNELITQGDFSYASGLVSTERLLSLTKKPSAIFASNDEMAAGALAAAYKKGLRVPDSLSIVGFDDSPIAMAVYPQLTTVRQSLSDMIEKAVEILAKPQTDNKNKIVILDHALVLRDSTGPALDT